MISHSLLENRNAYSTKLLICTGFGKVFTLAVSMNCGMVGGFVFPVISIGLIAGIVANKQYEDLPLCMCIACFLAAVPAAICPMPYTLLGISCFMFFLGLQQTVPVFISCVVAYLMFTGIGIMGALQSRAQAQDKKRKERLNKKKEAMNKANEELKPSQRNTETDHDHGRVSFARANSSLGYGRATNLDW
jgi:H+/Cl- antiporter ClcA